MLVVHFFIPFEIGYFMWAVVKRKVFVKLPHRISTTLPFRKKKEFFQISFKLGSQSITDVTIQDGLIWKKRATKLYHTPVT